MDGLTCSWVEDIMICAMAYFRWVHRVIGRNNTAGYRDREGSDDDTYQRAFLINALIKQSKLTRSKNTTSFVPQSFLNSEFLAYLNTCS